MPAIKESIGNTEILIQTSDIELIGDEEGFGTTPTSIDPNDIENVYGRAKLVIKAIAEDIGTDLKEMGQNVTKPNKVEMEFNLGFSARANAWFISAGGDYALAVKMTWELSDA
ncbi:MAG: hypothetical protein KDJ65_22090 [Anaerolineae bacterium]|nr:hypothetical protein [Anaerolineae bacterium]